LRNLPDSWSWSTARALSSLPNRGLPRLDRELLLGGAIRDRRSGAARGVSRRCHRTLTTGMAQTLETLDVFGHWWSCRFIPPVKEGDHEHTTVICTDVSRTIGHRGGHKERRLLRRLLNCNERERRLTATTFTTASPKQLTGALFRLQGFREMHARNPAES